MTRTSQPAPSQPAGWGRRIWWTDALDGAELTRAVHAANLALSARTPAEPPFVIGWDLVVSPTVAGIGVSLDVDDDPDLAQTWADHLGPGSWGTAQGSVLPWPATQSMTRWWPLDERSIAGQFNRDGGVVDRFHVNQQAVHNFQAWVEDRVRRDNQATFYRVESAGVRTYWPCYAGAPAVEQTVTDVLDGYGGPVHYALLAGHAQGWDEVVVGPLGKTVHRWWRV